MDEYTIQELAENLATYYRGEPEPDYTTEGMLVALRWAWERNEVASVWATEEVIDRAWEKFDVKLAVSSAREIMLQLAELGESYAGLDYCIQQWINKRGGKVK